MKIYPESKEIPRNIRKAKSETSLDTLAHQSCAANFIHLEINEVHNVILELGNTHYFYSFGIINDELRNFRFYKNNFAYLNVSAISYIFERFSDFAFDEKQKF